jgi:hypothetical protein
MVFIMFISSFAFVLSCRTQTCLTPTTVIAVHATAYYAVHLLCILCLLPLVPGRVAGLSLYRALLSEPRLVTGQRGFMPLFCILLLPPLPRIPARRGVCLVG